MPTTGVINGSNLRIYTNGTAIDCEVDGSLDVTREVKETLCKDSAPAGTKDVGKLDWTMSVSGLLKFDGSNGAPELYDLLAAGTSVTVRLSTEVAGDDYFEGTAYITAMNISGVVEENAEFSATFTGSGDLTHSTV